MVRTADALIALPIAGSVIGRPWPPTTVTTTAPSHLIATPPHSVIIAAHRSSCRDVVVVGERCFVGAFVSPPGGLKGRFKKTVKAVVVVVDGAPAMTDGPAA